ncbi:MAG: YkgJ family cysteine cluster protein, partial [Bryobacteraceae bacterium]
MNPSSSDSARTPAETPVRGDGGAGPVSRGCIFLDGTTCTVYDARPRTCENFPHLTTSEGSLVSRMWEMVDRAVYCPIVYNTLEAWKDELG